jgi:hypothetical protein
MENAKPSGFHVLGWVVPVAVDGLSDWAATAALAPDQGNEG